MLDFDIRTADEHPELIPRIAKLSRELFPRFIFEGDRAIRDSWDPFLESFPSYQFALFKDYEMVAAGVTSPLWWDGSSEGLPDRSANLYPREEGEFNVCCALAGLVVPSAQGKGLSRSILLVMRRIAEQHGFSSLIAPVRPNHKERYPLLPMKDYIEWRREDGYLFDPWMRVHERLHASVHRIMPEGVRAEGTVAEWEEWTGMRFMSSGSYVVPGALTPVEINVEKNEGVYIEPNVWMEHKIPQ
ncbi:hypothetical protein [Desmospora profundinema]|uniref:GNAT superfamily N-acetyltransferase n=1 Tax=Desmospora profundinema TaxID=1571184 RepID=A0ABU1IN26_9BACL|nr:hypothetical protein [Desmospora profundinema]MDR6226174.1 GNAT superfamily N-acetyltransferase [Desmospora profundinema]